MVAAIAVTGCGDESVTCTGEALAVPADKRIVELSGGQRSEVCDWGVCQLGGYGARPICPNGISITVSPDRRHCLASTPSNPACQATVADWTRCMEAVRASPCVETFLLGSECSAVTTDACLVFTPNALLDSPNTPSDATRPAAAEIPPAR
jgi:hypothetical protein